MQKLRTLAVAAVAALAITACSSDNDLTTPNRNASLRVVHASPDAPPVQVLLGNLTAVPAASFGQATGFLEAPAGENRIRVIPVGGTTPVIDATVDFERGETYTVLATGLVAGIQPLVAVDNLTNPPAGQVKIRVIHAAPAAAGVDVYATAPGADINTATPVLTNVPFRGVSDYLTVPAGTYQLRVTPTGTKTVAIDATVTLNASAIRTVVAIDAVGGGAPLSAIVLADVN